MLAVCTAGVGGGMLGTGGSPAVVAIETDTGGGAAGRFGTVGDVCEAVMEDNGTGGAGTAGMFGTVGELFDAALSDGAAGMFGTVGGSMTRDVTGGNGGGGFDARSGGGFGRDRVSGDNEGGATPCMTVLIRPGSGGDFNEPTDGIPALATGLAPGARVER